MSKIIEGTIPTLFGGVSRQPPQVRQPNQVQEQTNALSSVITGGFEKRPATQYVADLTFLDNTKEYQVHGIDRSETDQVLVMVDGATPSIKAVSALTGAEITVTIADTKRYFLVENINNNVTGIVEDSTGTDFVKQLAFDASETTFDWGWQLSDGSTGRFKVEGSVDGVVWNDIQTGIGGATSGTFSTTIGAVATGDHNYIRFTVTTGMATAADTITIWATFKDLTYILGANTEDLRMVSVADHTFLANRNVITALTEVDNGTITSTVQEFSDLPAAAADDSIHRVQGSNLDGFGTYFVKDDAATTTYIEVVDPTGHNTIDGSTMPHQLVRAADGLSFTYKAATWDPRAAGDETVNPAPGFIGKTIGDITFYRNRLVLVADETVYLSQSGDVFNMFASKATDVLDTDPIERGATTNEVNILRFATTFRKILFCTSGRAQFELTSTTSLTPTSAEMDQATTYAASLIAKPANMGDVLYFGSRAEGNAVVYEYFFQDTTLSNTASNVTRHITDYLPNDLLFMDADPTTTTLFALSTGEQNALYIYRTFFDVDRKQQSAWAKYTFGAAEANAFIHGFKIFSGFVVMIIERDDGNIYLEQFPIEREALEANMPFQPLIDQRDDITGTYNSTHDVTHWDTDWEHNDDAVVVLGGGGAIPGRSLQVSYTDKYTLTLASVAAGETLAIGGKTFTAHATTTTTANREFSIAGTDSADGDELVTVLNDATDGIGGTHLAANAAGVVTVVPLDKVDGTIAAPTGTTITNATIVATEVNDLVAARGDHSAADAYVGRTYTMTVELSKIWVREEGNVPIVTGRLQILDMTVLYEKTGYFELRITPDGGRPALPYFFNGKVLGSSETIIDSPSISSSGAFGHKKVLSEGDKVKVELINDQPSPCVITSVQWRGQFNEIGRAE